MRLRLRAGGDRSPCCHVASLPPPSLQSSCPVCEVGVAPHLCGSGDHVPRTLPELSSSCNCQVRLFSCRCSRNVETRPIARVLRPCGTQGSCGKRPASAGTFVLPPKWICGSPGPQWDRVRRRGLWGRPGLDATGSAPLWEAEVSKVSAYSGEGGGGGGDTARRWPSVSQDAALAWDGSCQHPDLGRPPAEP